jgi:DegV family protein with EDD domain
MNLAKSIYGAQPPSACGVMAWDGVSQRAEMGEDGMSNHRIAIMTDSTSDLPAELVQRHDIHVVPLYVLWSGEQLRDGVDIDHATFYGRLPQDPAHPTTSQPTPADFVQAIEAIEADEVVVVCISDRLSGTIASANAAKAMLSRPLHVVDSGSVSMGLGWQALAAARARDAGASAQEIVAAVEAVRANMHVVFTVETLEYLHKGGRIGAAAKLLGTALQLKPLLTIRPELGMIEPLERVRSRKRSLSRVVEVILEQLDTSRPLHIGIMHAVAQAEADAMAEELRARVSPAELVMANVTPVVGTHGGPGVIGIAAYNE